MTTTIIKRDNPLAMLGQLRQALIRSKDLKDLATVAKGAISIQQALSRAGHALAVVNDAGEIWIEALWLCGKAMKERRGGDRRSGKTNSMDHAVDLGFARNYAQQLCRRLPRRSIAPYVRAATEDRTQATAAGCLNYYRRPATVRTPKAPRGTYATIVADPPWSWDDEGDVSQMGRGTPDYPALTIEELRALPVKEWSAPDAHLYLWITNRSLPKGFGLLEAWGFRYVICLTWCKPSIGLGNYFRGQTEHVLFGVRGSLPLKRKDVGTWFAAPRPSKKHSSKPSKFLSLVESCSPGPYLEMFARSRRKGWASWGSDLE